jgi:hypothetical protein
LEMIARLSGYETRWERQAALGIEGKYHGGIIPPRSVLSTNCIVCVADRAGFRLLNLSLGACIGAP